ncbi:hypothetical protein RB195_002114 [Necator americanus]|uniref:Thyroglobulin type-1 domain-containing protein n=1 Tax=Necator americanus TaxID=51031 RepID=A0ABR1DHE9_NECAM
MYRFEKEEQAIFAEHHVYKNERTKEKKNGIKIEFAEVDVEMINRNVYAHKIACRNDVAWMFQQWDGDNDGLLSKDELMPLEGNGREVCLAQFIDMCDDMVVDGSISVDEWCDCFSFADDLRHEPPCHKAKHSVDPHMAGVFLPRCDLEGFYRPEQCHSGYCWCVDRYGREFDHSRTKGELPDCGQYANDLDDEEKIDLKHRL